MKASVSVVFLAPALMAGSLSAATFVPSSESNLFGGEPIRVVGAGPGFTPTPQERRASQATTTAQTEARPARPGDATAARSPANHAATHPAAAAATAAAESAIQYVFYCFGPVFGNDGREVDPNYMPPPTVAYRAPVRPTVSSVRYTRVTENTSPETTWVGADGSRISYFSRQSASPHDAEPTAGNTSENPLTVAEVIAENRRELTKISWARTYRRYPELEQPNSPERVAFDVFVSERQADTRETGQFENPMWPETLSSEFMTQWNWKKAEEESWDRVRTRVLAFNDVTNPYTRRFLEFTAGLRADPRDAAIFQHPTWPELALELHDERLGPVPRQSP